MMDYSCLPKELREALEEDDARYERMQEKKWNHISKISAKKLDMDSVDFAFWCKENHMGCRGWHCAVIHSYVERWSKSDKVKKKNKSRFLRKLQDIAEEVVYMTGYNDFSCGHFEEFLDLVDFLNNSFYGVIENG